MQGRDKEASALQCSFFLMERHWVSVKCTGGIISLRKSPKQKAFASLWTGGVGKVLSQSGEKSPNNEVSEWRPLGYKCRCPYEDDRPWKQWAVRRVLDCSSLQKSAVHWQGTKSGLRTVAMRPTRKILVVTQGQAWKITHRILDCNQTPQCRGWQQEEKYV